MKTSSRISLVLVSLTLMASLAGCAQQGAAGTHGAAGHAGAAGPRGATGKNGAPGATGATGARGAAGTAGTKGAAGAAGAAGPAGPAGVMGAVGPAGPIGAPGSGEAAEFYALMPLDNMATVAPGDDVQFPQDGPSTTSDILRVDDGSFDLVTAGVYQVSFQVSVNEAGQLVLALDGTGLPYTVVGRATGTSQITLTALVHSNANQVLTVSNPPGGISALTVTPLAGGVYPVSATLLIELVKAD
jgi:hypothetical protein